MEGPRSLKLSEYDELVSLLTRVFHYDDPKSRYDLESLRTLWLFEHDVDDLLVIEEDGKIVSHVGIFPSEVSVRGCVLKVGQIGDVATDEKYRGRGFASALLKRAVAKMATEAYDLSSLGGLRDRYGRFGWELAGEEKVYSVDQRSVRAVSESSEVECWKYPRAESDLAKIVEIHDREPVGTVRSSGLYDLLFNDDFVRTREAWLAEAAGCAPCYVVLERAQEGVVRIVEYGGDPQVFRLYLRSLFDDGLERAEVVAPNIYTPFTPVLSEVSRSYHLRPLGMIRIMNLASLLRKLAPLFAESIGRRRPDSPFSLTLEISGTGETVTLDYNGGMQISERPGRERIRLGQRDMARLLFGPGRPAQNFSFENKILSILDALFPVEFYLWPMDRR